MAPPTMTATASKFGFGSSTGPTAASLLDLQSPSAIAEVPPPSTNAVSRVVSQITFVLLSAVVCCALFPFVLLAAGFGCLFDNKQRRLNDDIVKLWARLTLTLFGAQVTIEGADNLPPVGTPVMFTPNHCAFLDVYVLSAFLPRRFKYISKVENLRLPILGWSMALAKHIAISRMDRASQMRTLKEAVQSLNDGNCIVAFPEGTRSWTGKLLPFKKGPFTMASRAGVKVVPITIVGTHLFQQPRKQGGGLPFAPPRGVRIVCHQPLDPPRKKCEEETMAEARKLMVSAMPPSMRPDDVDGGQ